MSTRPKRDTKPPNRFDEAPAPTKTTSHSPPAPLDDAAPPTKKLRLANKVSPPLEGTPVAATKKKPPPKLSVKKAKADTAAAQLAPTDASISVRAVGAISGDSTTIGPNLVENATNNLHVQSTPGASKSTPNDPIIVSPLPSTLSSTMRDPKRATTSLPIPKNKGNTPSSKKEASGKTPETTATKATPTADVNVQDAAARRKMLYGAVPSAPSFKKVSFDVSLRSPRAETLGRDRNPPCQRRMRLTDQRSSQSSRSLSSLDACTHADRPLVVPQSRQYISQRRSDSEQSPLQESQKRRKFKRARCVFLRHH